VERRKFLGALTGTSLGVLFNASLGRLAQAENVTPGASPHGSGASQFPPNSTIILVHAAWADGSCWHKLILPLQRRGLHVICAPIPLTSLTNDAAALSQVLERTSGPVVLVGHAYSGAVIAAVANDRIKSLVYITALAPDEGETVAKVFYLNPNSPQAPKMVPDSHGHVWLPDDAFSQAITHKASADESKIAAALQRPLSVDCIKETAPTPTWKTKPTWFLVAEDDRMINPKTQHFMADRMGAKIHSYPVDHSPMISAPNVVMGVILEAAHETLRA
jgi:pimeloyl-ACP methyl ester carboxylesterase